MGGIEHLPAVAGDRTLELRHLHDLIKAGWTREHVLAVTGWSPATFYRRLGELQRHNPRITCPTLRSGDLNIPVEMVVKH